MTEGPDRASVFVVHGRNEAVRRALFEFLRAIGLKPMEWGHALKESGKGSPFIGEVLDIAFQRAQAVVVLLTGDDLAKLQPQLLREDDPPYESELSPQPRANVLFEAGMAFGRQADRTVIVQVGSLRAFSDIAGRHAVRLKGDLTSRQDLASRLETAGCPVDLRGTDWHTAGDFDVLPFVPPSPAGEALPIPASLSLEPEEFAILEHLAEREAAYDHNSASASEIAEALDIPIPRTKHFIAKLETKDLIVASYFLDRATRYSLSREGRRQLIDLGKI